MFWPTLMKRRGTKELKQVKSLSLKIQEAKSNVAITEKKKGKMPNKSYIPSRCIYLQKLPLIMTLGINQ